LEKVPWTLQNFLSLRRLEGQAETDKQDGGGEGVAEPMPRRCRQNQYRNNSERAKGEGPQKKHPVFATALIASPASSPPRDPCAAIKPFLARERFQAA
jgi:hypothetical protein